MGGVKTKKMINVRFTGRRIEASEFLIRLVDSPPPLLFVKFRLCSYPPFLDGDLKFVEFITKFHAFNKPH